jgi:hypothetical protein
MFTWIKSARMPAGRYDDFSASARRVRAAASDIAHVRANARVHRRIV